MKVEGEGVDCLKKKLTQVAFLPCLSSRAECHCQSHRFSRLPPDGTLFGSPVTMASRADALLGPFQPFRSSGSRAGDENRY